jgi:signal transduction histidine kinase
VFDHIFAPDKWFVLLLFRFGLLVIGFICITLSKRISSARNIQILCLLGASFIALQTDAVIWVAKDTLIYNYVGLIFVTMGASCFIPFSRTFWLLCVMGTYLPYFVGWFLIFPHQLPILAANSFYIVSTVIISFFISEYNERLRYRELLSRLKLEEEIKRRDQIISSKAREMIDLELDIQKERIIGDIARHVSHDIRSPISAMNLVIGSLKELPDAKRTLLTEAVKRVNDIANDLLTKSREMNKVSSTHSIAPVKISELHACVDDILKEKRIQYQDEEIDFLVTQEAQRGVVEVRLEPVKFKRIISNLLNNSIEALDGDGRVEISLSQTSSHLVVQIKDNGRGIPMDVLPKLMTEGFTHGKSNGNGLGLFTARRDIESWGGNITLMSSVESGTTVSIRLPLS